MKLPDPYFDSKKKFLRGNVLHPNESQLLFEKFEEFDGIKDLIRFLMLYGVIGHIFSIDESNDSSGFGVEMEWLQVDDIIEEGYEFYPGILAVKKGFLPIGKCLEGSGDPYFLKKEENVFSVYRIPHEQNSKELDIHSVEKVGSLTVLFDSLKD